MYPQQSVERFGPLKVGRGWFGKEQYAINFRCYDYETRCGGELNLNKVFDCIDDERENTQVPNAVRFVVDGHGGVSVGNVLDPDPTYRSTEDAIDLWDELMMRDDDCDMWHGLWHGAAWTTMTNQGAFCFAVGAMVKFLVDASKGATATIVELHGRPANDKRLYRNVVRKDSVADRGLYLLRLLPVKRNPTFTRRKRLIISA